MSSNKLILSVAAVGLLIMAMTGCGSSTSSGPVDTAPPAVPTGLSAQFDGSAVKLGWDAHPNLGVRFALENITDANYREHGSGIDAPGINAILSVEGRF